MAKSKNDNALLIVIILTAVFVFSITLRECRHHAPVVHSDSLQRVVIAYRDKIDSLKEINDELLLNREVKVKQVTVWRERWRHDTALITHYDTACHELVKENRMLWEIVADDSLLIGNQGAVIRWQDSVIGLQEQRIEAIQQRHKAEMKQQKKALRIARLSAGGLAALLGLSLVR